MTGTADLMVNPEDIHIFFIEDDEPIRSAFCLLMESYGYNVECAHNGAVAVEKLAQLQSLPDLIILDLMMPVMDGYQFRRFQLDTERLAKIPVILMSADGQLETKVKTMQLEHFLKKPIDVDHLLNTVQMIVQKHRAANGTSVEARP